MKNLPLFSAFLFLWLAATTSAQAQGKLTGVVQDSATHEPLAFASVFLANTTLGATTTEDGKFEFARVPAGTYDLVGSYVGYRLTKMPVTVAKTPQQVTLKLASTGAQLSEVVVQPEPNKPEEYKKFSELFLGGSTFSEQCHISTPEKVRVFYDDSTKELTARARDFVQIDNDALGYRLKYYGFEFGHNAEDRTVYYHGEPVFEEMTPRDDAQRQLWQANRLTAYRGSFMHYLRSVHTNSLRPDGFLNQQVVVGANPRFARADKQRQALLARRPNGPYSAAERDSLARWDQLPPVIATLNIMPRPIDSVRRVAPDGRTFLRFTGELQVAYFNEAPDPRYREAMSPLGYSRKPYPALRQVSRLKLQGREAEIQANGSLLNPLDVYIGEYWAFEKIGEFLPFDYVPPAAAPGPTPSTNLK